MPLLWSAKFHHRHEPFVSSECLSISFIKRTEHCDVSAVRKRLRILWYIGRKRWHITGVRTNETNNLAILHISFFTFVHWQHWQAVWLTMTPTVMRMRRIVISVWLQQ